ncbi:MAG: hypothetical protein IPG63_17755 [Xanthomonadales bacterium]|nr:hypothetical protein [Xanthomonadales bacterium]
MTAAMGVYDLFIGLDSTLQNFDNVALERLQPIFEFATNDDIHSDQFFNNSNGTLERIVNQLSRLFGIQSNLSDPNDNEARWAQIALLQAQNSAYTANVGDFHIEFVGDLSASELAAAARADLGYLYALLQQNMFVLAGNNAYYAESSHSTTLTQSQYSDAYLNDFWQALSADRRLQRRRE